MLTSIGIKGFKSYKSAELPLAPLTVLIGANASGKSNAIEALRLLSWIGRGNRLDSIRYAIYDGDQAVRGTVRSLSFHGGNDFTLFCDMNYSDYSRYLITLSIDQDDDLHIVDERITGPGSTVPLYEVVARSEGAGTDLRVAYNNFARGGKKPQVTCSDHVAILHQLQSSARFESSQKNSREIIPTVCEAYQKNLSGVLFLDPNPPAMRNYSFQNEHRLRGDGSNISGVLASLCNENSNKQEVLELIRSLPEQNISDISFIETPRNEAMVMLEETFGGVQHRFDATLLSDGTLRVLSIAAAILSAPEGSLVIIEEIDNGIHPSRADGILKSISDLAKRRDLRVLISSHNPALLDALPDDAVPNVVFCYRDPTDGSSRLVRLQDIPDYPELIAQGTVGHLMTRGIIDRFVKSDHSPQGRKDQFQAWLRDLEQQTARD